MFSLDLGWQPRRTRTPHSARWASSCRLGTKRLAPEAGSVNALRLQKSGLLCGFRRFLGWRSSFRFCGRRNQVVYVADGNFRIVSPHFQQNRLAELPVSLENLIRALVFLSP